MYMPAYRSDRPAEYSIMVEPRPAGPTVGVYGGLPIAERVVDRFGRRFAYVGIARRPREGRFDVADLRPGELIVEPGLVYRLESDENLPRRAANTNRPSPALSRRLPEDVGPATDPGEAKRALVEIAAAPALFLTGALAVQLVLHLLHAG
jgi:hypothetical protein